MAGLKINYAFGGWGGGGLGSQVRAFARSTGNQEKREHLEVCRSLHLPSSYGEKWSRRCKRTKMRSGEQGMAKELV